jgi:hypothetical protein
MNDRAIQIWLDDERRAPFGMVQTNTAEDTIELLKKCKVSVLSLDHDLGENRKTGYSVLTWMEQQVATTKYVPPTHIYVHSANPVGRKKMDMAINKIRKLEEARK